MTDKLDSAMIRELSGDELLVVAGGQEMEREATRYTAPSQEADILGWRFQYNPNNGCLLWRGVKVEGQPRSIIADTCS